MADPICRWRNSSLKQIIEFNSLFPLCSLEKNEGRRIVEKNWALLGGSSFFTTPYQLAAQMGLYYEDDAYMYSRFDKLISLDEGLAYLNNWGKRYYAPNPYTKSMQQDKTPVVINNFLVNWVLDKEDNAFFSEALDEMFVDTIGNTDILINMLNNFSEVKIENNKVLLKDVSRKGKYQDSEIWIDNDARDKKAFFDFFGVGSSLHVGTTVFNIESIVEKAQSTGLIYSEILIKRLAYSLMAKPFVILSGLAGSGKTQLALAFAKCLSENIEEQVCTVSIGADWTNREPLLGYPNALKNEEYVKPESGVLQLLMRANEDPSKPYFLILDEMNLSVVERYFADFLSAMESGEPIKLWDNEKGNVPKEIALPMNVFIIGTINVDETTYMFSPKVLDRANVIEFKIAPEEMEQYLNEKKDIHLEAAFSACADMAMDFVNKANSQIQIENGDEKPILLSFFQELKKVNAEFGYRTVNEIGRYLHFADGNMDATAAIDTAILQKLLPKLHGSRKKLVPTLTALWDICLNDGNTTKIDTETEKLNFQDGFKYPESAEKIKRMYDAVIDNGFTSFAEA